MTLLDKVTYYPNVAQPSVIIAVILQYLCWCKDAFLHVLFSKYVCPYGFSCYVVILWRGSVIVLLFLCHPIQCNHKAAGRQMSDCMAAGTQ